MTIRQLIERLQEIQKREYLQEQDIPVCFEDFNGEPLSIDNIELKEDRDGQYIVLE